MEDPLNVKAKGITFVVAASLMGCGTLDPDVCTADLTWRVTPTEANLTVGESVTAEAEAFGCGGREPLAEEMRWSSADPTVASVNEITGLISAEATGITKIIGVDMGPYGIGPVEIPVTVEP